MNSISTVGQKHASNVVISYIQKSMSDAEKSVCQTLATSANGENKIKMQMELGELERAGNRQRIYILLIQFTKQPSSASVTRLLSELDSNGNEEWKRWKPTEMRENDKRKVMGMRNVLCHPSLVCTLFCTKQINVPERHEGKCGGRRQHSENNLLN